VRKIFVGLLRPFDCAPHGNPKRIAFEYEYEDEDEDEDEKILAKKQECALYECKVHKGYERTFFVG
jgi:hypothetical protein